MLTRLSAQAAAWTWLSSSMVFRACFPFATPFRTRDSAFTTTIFSISLFLVPPPTCCETWPSTSPSPSKNFREQHSTCWLIACSVKIVVPENGFLQTGQVCDLPCNRLLARVGFESVPLSSLVLTATQSSRLKGIETPVDRLCTLCGLHQVCASK